MFEKENYKNPAIMAFQDTMSLLGQFSKTSKASANSPCLIKAVRNRGGRGPDWAGFACFSQPAPQWTGLKIKIRNPHNKWSTRWALGSADRDGFMRVRVFFYYFFYGPKTRKIIHNLVNPIQILKIPIESTSPANNNKKKEL
jgi:hypothetical protein